LSQREDAVTEEPQPNRFLAGDADVLAEEVAAAGLPDLLQQTQAADKAEGRPDIQDQRGQGVATKRRDRQAPQESTQATDERDHRHMAIVLDEVADEDEGVQGGEEDKDADPGQAETA
jgi:hypothetical protein